jgi:hypothetical protein
MNLWNRFGSLKKLGVLVVGIDTFKNEVNDPIFESQCHMATCERTNKPARNTIAR